MISVYLAGAINDKADFGKNWRTDFEEEYGDQFKILNPLDVHDGEDLEFVVDGGEQRIESKHSVSAEQVVEADKQMIDDADVVYVKWEQGVEHCGTPMEVMYSYERDYPVVVEYDGTDMYQGSIWLHAHSDFVAESREECVERLSAYAEEVEDDE